MKRFFSLGDTISELISLPSLKVLHQELSSRCGGKKVLWVADSNSARYLPEYAEYRLVLPPGEGEKHLGSIQAIIDRALEITAARDSRFVALGGGVVCDMTAFAASIYMRGLPVILVPSTLLAMVDASLGGKSGVDYQNRKNIIGSFHPAEGVYICPELLSSLPEDQLRNGVAEMIKHGMLGGNSDLNHIESAAPGIISGKLDSIGPILEENIAIKGRYVESDPREGGIRAHLNLGHTFAHALEGAGKLQNWSHGEAVAWGLARAIAASEKLGLCQSSYRQRVETLLQSLDYRLSVQISPHLIMEALGADKKRRNGEIHFILQKGPGDTLSMPLEKRLIEETIREGCTG